MRSPPPSNDSRSCPAQADQQTSRPDDSATRPLGSGTRRPPDATVGSPACSPPAHGKQKGSPTPSTDPHARSRLRRAHSSLHGGPSAYRPVRGTVRRPRSRWHQRQEARCWASPVSLCQKGPAAATARRLAWHLVPWVNLPPDCFLHDLNSRFVYGQRRWYSPDGSRIYTWDGEHGGEVEVFNKRGHHLAVAHPVTGETIKPAVRGRSIDV
ncbi:colicin E3/pyocin S6 family cytotoxin [Streptomyces sp. NPDC048179]|uniref:colicin E3/pyocin S6 family cytotoxin n=1 Tax=Streptomyces sp. NPDC048179 TaxID=3365506 RepID=UPI00371F708F